MINHYLPEIGHLVSGINLFGMDALTLFFASFSTVVGFLILLFSLPYTRGKEHRPAFYLYLLLFWLGMMGVVFTRHLVILYLFWEITALASWRLIGFYRGPKDVRAANQALLVTFFGSTLMLIAFLLLYLQNGTFNMQALTGTPLNQGLFILLLAGALAKSAIFPFNRWLPDAGVAPAPVTAFLHAAVLVKIGLYAFIRFFHLVFLPPEATAWLSVLFLVSALAAGCSALREHDFKRILAYSTISQLSLVFFGLSFFNEIGLAGAFAFILAHALGKAGLFLVAGTVEKMTGQRDIRQMGGLIRQDPLLTGLFLVSALSVIGLPPFIGFWGKILLLAAPFQETYLGLGLLGIISAGLTLVYLLRVFYLVFLGETKPENAFQEPVPRLFYGSISILAAGSLFFGLWPNLLQVFLK